MNAPIYVRRYYAAKRAAGLCCKCKRRAKLKRNGKLASMCAKHLQAVKLNTARYRRGDDATATDVPPKRRTGRPERATQRNALWPDYPTDGVPGVSEQPTNLGRCPRCRLAGEHVCLPQRATELERYSGPGPTYPAALEALSSRAERARINHYAPAPVYARQKRQR